MDMIYFAALICAEIKPTSVETSITTKEMFAQAKLKPDKFKYLDVVLAKRSGLQGDHAAQVWIDLATIFAEADADHDGQLTFDEWSNRCGKCSKRKRSNPKP